MKIAVQEVNDNDEILERGNMYAAFAAAFRGSVNPDEVGMLSISFPEDTPDSRAEYLNAFDVAVSSNACSLHGADYTSQDRTSLYQDLVQFYEYFGVKRRDGAELPDHVSVKLEFLHYLVFRELAALEQGNETGSLQRAERDLLDRHVIPLAEHIDRASKSPQPHYIHLTGMLVKYLTMQRTRLSAIEL